MHKRGQGDYGTKLPQQTGISTERVMTMQEPKTMERLAREGAAQAMASGGFNTEEDEASELTFKNDTTAMSDLNSLQNFSYYGRRFQDQNFRQ